VEKYKAEHRSLKGFPNVQMLTNAELLELSVDVLIPAALENQLTKENAERVQAKMVLELANGPTTPEADEILRKRGIKVVPDILANAGGVVVSTLEWEQNKKNEHWSEEVVLERLRETLVPQASTIYKNAEESDVTMRVAAFRLALERLETSLKSLR